MFKKGDSVEITYEGRTVSGTVVLVSPNQRSLAVTFEAILGGHAGTMLLLRENDDVPYCSIITGGAAIVIPAKGRN